MDIASTYGKYALYGCGGLIAGLSTYFAQDRVRTQGPYLAEKYADKGHNVLERIAGLQAGFIQSGLYGAAEGTLLGLLIVSTPLTLLGGAASVAGRAAKQRFMPTPVTPKDGTNGPQE